jgi:outer membrane protein assembly factor BamB
MKKLGKTSLILLLTSFSATLAAAPMAFSINSDSASPDPYSDSLYEIDLDGGSDKYIAQLDPRYLDVEGLAFAPDGKLYALDDDKLKILELVPGTQAVQVIGEKSIQNLPSTRDNDFGMTFACDGTLYITSVKQKSLYRLELTGALTLIGELGVNISALAAWGNNPTELYGLGNGLRNQGNDTFVEDVPNLYRIDVDTGDVEKIGALGDLALPYTEGGLDFDKSGQLWAITDRQFPDYDPSQVMKLDKATGLASEVKTLKEYGFESLAIAPPGGCSPLDDAPPVDAANYRSVPALGPFGLALASGLLLLTGLLATRRF